MLAGISVALGILLVIMIATGSVFLLVQKFLGSNRLAVISGSLFAPLFVVIVGALDVFLNQEVDGPPPGMILVGLVTASVVLLPITFAISLLLARLFPTHRVDHQR